MFGDFAEKKETFLTFFFYFNKPCSLKSKKSHFLLLLVKTMPIFRLFKRKFPKSKTSHFFKRVNPCFSKKKNAIFRLFRFGQNKTRNNA